MSSYSNLAELGSIQLRTIAKSMRKPCGLVHTPESVACVAKAASCVNDRAVEGAAISGRQIAVMDSAACVSVIQEAVVSGKTTPDHVEGIIRSVSGATATMCECGHAWDRHSKVADTGCLARSASGVYCQCKLPMPETATQAEPAEVEIESEEPIVPSAVNVNAIPVNGEVAPALRNALVALLGDAIAPRSAPLDENRVRQIVSEVARETAQTITIKIERKDGSKVECKDEHFMFERLVRLMGAGIHVYLWGPAGTGKTTAALHAAHAIGKESEIDTLDPSTPKSGVLGYRTPTGEPAETAFTRMYKAGGVYIPDECDNGPAHVQSLLNSALANGHAPCAWGQVPRGDGFVLAGTGNTPGRPTPSFPDRRPMSAAFADRLYFMYWPLDPGIECRAAGLPVPRYPVRKEATCSASAWVTWVRGIRGWAERNAPTLMITPRASLLGMQALACGETPEEVAHGLVFRGADKTLVEKALNACSLPG